MRLSWGPPSRAGVARAPAPPRRPRPGRPAPPCGRLRPGALQAQRGAPPTAAPPVPFRRPRFSSPSRVWATSRVLPNTTLGRRTRTPRAGAAALSPRGRGTRPRPRRRGTGGEGRVSRRSGRDEYFRGWGRTCGDRRGVASGVAFTVRKAVLPPASESGAGPGPSAAVTARSGGRRASNGRRDLARGGQGAAVAAGLNVDATLCRQALGTLDGAGMVKAPTPKRAPGDPAAQPGHVRKLTQKKKKKKRFWPNTAREVSEKPASDPKVVSVRPPKAPEDFSQNWKALQEVRRESPPNPAIRAARFWRSPQFGDGREAGLLGGSELMGRRRAGSRCSGS